MNLCSRLFTLADSSIQGVLVAPGEGAEEQVQEELRTGERIQALHISPSSYNICIARYINIGGNLDI